MTGNEVINGLRRCFIPNTHEEQVIRDAAIDRINENNKMRYWIDETRKGADAVYRQDKELQAKVKELEAKLRKAEQNARL